MRAFIDSSSIIATEGDDSVMIGAADPAYAAVRDYLTIERGQDFSYIRHLVGTVRVAVKDIVSEAVSVVDGDSGDDTAYRLKHGDPVAETVLSTALRLAFRGVDLAPLEAFLARLERNPSEASRSQLFGWLKAGGFTLTTDGLIVGYKSVREDGYSAHSGFEPVTVTYQDGTSETVTGHVPYPVGATVSMPRELVATSREHACSTGLHVGTFSYASNFSERMLVVLVDPEDVVSVPQDCNAEKMRVCALFVAAINDGEQISEAVLDVIRTVPDPDAVQEYASRPENQRPATVDDEDNDDYDDYDDQGDDYEDDLDVEDYDENDDDCSTSAEHDRADADTGDKDEAPRELGVIDLFRAATSTMYSRRRRGRR